LYGVLFVCLEVEKGSSAASTETIFFLCLVDVKNYHFRVPVEQIEYVFINGAYTNDGHMAIKEMYYIFLFFNSHTTEFERTVQ